MLLAEIRWLIIENSPHPTDGEERLYYHVFDIEDTAETWVSERTDSGWVRYSSPQEVSYWSKVDG